MKKIIIVLIIILNVHIFAQNNTETFLDLNVSPIGEGTSGNIITSMYYSNFIYNPAVFKNNKIFIEYEHKFLMNSLSHYNSVFLLTPVYSNVGIGIGYINQIISDIPEYPEYNDSLMNNNTQVFFTPISYFNDYANAFYFNVSYSYKRDEYSKYIFNFGINVKYIYHSIYDFTGTGSGIDFGISANSDLNKIINNLKGNVKYSIVLEDIGNTDIKWDTPSEHVDQRKMKIKTGIAYNILIRKIESKIDMEIDYRRINDLSTIGGSVIYSYDNLLFLYSGINIYKDANIQYGMPSIGVGINVLNFNINFGMSNNDMGYNYSIGIKYSL